MGATCCGGMKSGQQKSLPEHQKTNNVAEKDISRANGPQDDAAVTKETPAVTGDQQQQSTPLDQEASSNHTVDHAQPSVLSPQEVELKITEPDQPAEPELEPVPAVCPTAEQPTVCPGKPPAPDVQPPTSRDEGAEEHQNQPLTDVLLVTEDGDIVPPKDEPASEVTTTLVTEHAQTSESTEVRTTIVDETPASADAFSASAQKDEEQQQEVGKVINFKPPKPAENVVTSTGAEVSQAPLSSVDEQASASVEAPAVSDEAVDAPPAMTEETDSYQIQSDADVVAGLPAAEVVVAASTADQQESVPPPPSPAAAATEEAEQVPDEQMQQQHLASSTDMAAVPPEQLDVQRPDEQLSDETVRVPPEGTDSHQKQADSDVVAEAPATEFVVAASAPHHQQSVPPLSSAATEQSEQVPEEQLQQHDSASSADVAPFPPEQLDAERQEEQLSSELVDLPTAVVQPSEEAAWHDETSARPGEEPVQPEQHAAVSADVAAEVPEEEPHHDAAGDNPAFSAVSTDEPQPTAEEITSQSRDVDASEVHVSADTESVPLPVVDRKQEDAASSPAMQDEVGEIQPEELPPPLTPEAQENHQTPSVTNVEPPTEISEQPDQHTDVNNAVDNVEEPTSKSISDSDEAKHVDEVPVTGEP